MSIKQLEFDDRAYNGSVKLFEVDPPIEGNRFVLVSTVDNGYGLMGMGEYYEESAVFACNEEGEDVDWNHPLFTTDPVEDHGTFSQVMAYLKGEWW
jgi:hypothetical protein